MGGDSDTSQQYCIIGAGPSGLAMAAAFRRRGIPYRHLEAREGLGGVWNVENPGTPMYESAHLISSKTRSGFPDFPMPDTYPDYPRHHQVLAYLEAYARKHRLVEDIEFQCPVERVTLDEGSALVTAQGRTRRYRGVVCASGVNWDPVIPEFPGNFSGEKRHVVSYRHADELAGKRVLIVGLGNSGADIACDAARVARRAVVSVRRGYHLVPKHIFGMPSDVFASRGPPLPLWLERPLFRFLHRLVVGDLRKLGMPEPDHALLDSHPVMNDQLVHHLRHGDVSIHGNIQRFEGSRVFFTDGHQEEFDLVLFATGYTRRILYLEAAALDPGAWPAAQFLTAFSRKHESLFTLGFVELNGALFPQVSRLAALIAELARYREQEPERVIRFYDWVRTARLDLSGGRRLIDSSRHAHYCDEHALERAIDQAFRVLGLDPKKVLRAPARELVGRTS